MPQACWSQERACAAATRRQRYLGESDPGVDSRAARVCDGPHRVEGFERLSGCARRSSTSPRAGEITTERRPAATSPAALAWLTTPSWSPIWVAATITVREVA